MAWPQILYLEMILFLKYMRKKEMSVFDKRKLHKKIEIWINFQHTSSHWTHVYSVGKMPLHWTYSLWNKRAINNFNDTWNHFNYLEEKNVKKVCNKHFMCERNNKSRPYMLLDVVEVDVMNNGLMSSIEFASPSFQRCIWSQQSQPEYNWKIF